MPLVIHPASCCDVCLEPFTYDERPPYAIPCGHIFCRECLFMMTPALCPLCRKPYTPERCKKLITGESEDREPEDRESIGLLKRLIESLGTDSQDSVVLEVGQWLNAGHAYAPLSKAHYILREYLLLKLEAQAYQRNIRRLEREIIRLRADQENDKENASVIQRDLQSQVRQLRSTVNDLEERRRNATTLTFRHNPLPTPPEPIPLETLPFFANRQQNLDEMSGVSSQWNLDASHNGFFLSDLPAPNSAGPPLPRHSSPEPTSIQEAQQNPPTQSPNNPRRRNRIIPGASPTQRFVPGFIPTNVVEPGHTPAWASMHGHVDAFALAEDYLTEYAEGYQEGYLMSQPSVQPSSRHNREASRPMEHEAPSQSPVQVAPNESRASSSSSRHTSAPSRPPRRPLGLADFYRLPAAASSSPLSSRETHENALAFTTPLLQLTHNASSSSVNEAIPFIPPDPHQLASSNAALQPTTTPPQPSVPPTNTVGSQLLSPPASAPAAPSSFTSYFPELSSLSSHGSNSSSARNVSSQPVPQLGTSTPSVLDSSLRRRSAFSATSIQPPLSSVLETTHTPGSRISRNSRGSLNSRPRSDASHSVHSATLHSFMVNRDSGSSWGTIERSDSPRPEPFVAAHNIQSVRDLGLARTLDLFYHAGSNNSGLSSQRSSLALSDVAPPFSSPQITEEDRDHAESLNEALNRTPRRRPISLDSATSSEISLPLYTSSQDTDWNAPSNNQFSHRNRDDDQHHLTAPAPSAVPEPWYHVVPESTRTSAHSHSHSNSNRSSVTSPSHISRPSTSGYTTDFPSMANALGLDIPSSPEPQISAPTPVTPSRSFLRSFSGGSRH